MGQLVAKTIPGFFNGVSQQSVTMRLDTQGEIQENAMGTIVDGLYKRPPTEHVSVFTDVNPADAFQHTINRDTSEQYTVFITDDELAPIEVHTLDGTKCTVRYGHLDADLVFTEDLDVIDYLETTQPLPRAYKAISIADYTMLTNRTKITAMTEDTQEGEVTGVVQTFLDLPLPFDTYPEYDNTKEYTKGDMVKYPTDSMIYYYINNTDATGNLPTDDEYWRPEEKYCSEGEIYEISGDEGNTFDNYYVVYDGETWRETLAPGEKYKLDATTMPHRLVRTGINQFTFAPCLWEDRVVGDEDSCPLPSFIGKSITNLAFFKNRLGFIAKDTFFLSRAGKYFELFGETAIDLLDDDPIDVLASSTNVVELASSIPFDKNLLLNSVQGQFSFGSSGTNLTPKTASITPTTMYVTDRDSDPVGAGANVYFVNPRSKFVSLMEYLIQPDTLTEDAADVTAHCPKYIPNGTISMVSCIPMDMLVLFTTGDTSALYVYKYYWVGNEKPQSAWSRWVIDGEILGIGLINTELLITIKRGTETCLERVQLENSVPDHPKAWITEDDLSLTATTIDNELDFRVHLDRQVRIKGRFDELTRLTTWTFPYKVTDFANMIGINPTTGFIIGGIEQVDDYTLQIYGNHSGYFAIFGTKYTMFYRMSEWYVKDQSKVAVIDSKLQIRTLALSYRDTGAFSLAVTPENREPIYKYFSGVKVGVSKIGTPALLTGEEKFLIMAKSKYTTIDIISDSYLPCQITSGAYEGLYVARAERL